MLNSIFSYLTGSVEVTLPVDKFTKKIKGFAIITYTPPETAVKAYAEMDGTVFQVLRYPCISLID